jgi:hypothetical protein
MVRVLFLLLAHFIIFIMFVSLLMLRLRGPNERTPPSAHFRTRRSSSDPICSSCPCAPMLAAPFPPCVAVPIHLPHSASRRWSRSPVASSVLPPRAASSAPHFPPGPVCLASCHLPPSSPQPICSPRPPPMS